MLLVEFRIFVKKRLKEIFRFLKKRKYKDLDAVLSIRNLHHDQNNDRTIFLICYTRFSNIFCF